MFEAVARLLEKLAQRQPLILFLDDMQWADASDWDMIHYLARHLHQARAPVLLLITARIEDLPVLEGSLAPLGREATLTRIHLPSLDASAIQRLINHLMENETPVDETILDAFIRWLHQMTAGIPFFIEAMLHMLAKEGVDVKSGSASRLDIAAAWRRVSQEGQTLIPPGARDVVLARLADLNDAARDLLLAGAILGRESSFERLCQIASMNEDAGVTALETLLRCRLFHEEPTDDRPYHLAHGILRQTVYAEATQIRRSHFHRRALASLERADAPAAELALHALAVHDHVRAFDYLLDAGDEALTAAAIDEALGHYDQAHQLLSQLPFQPDHIRRLIIRRGHVLELLSRHHDALTGYLILGSLGLQHHNDALILASLTARCRIHGSHTPLFQPELAQALGEQALRLARKLDDRPTEVQVLLALSMISTGRANFSTHLLGFGGGSAGESGNKFNSVVTGDST